MSRGDAKQRIFVDDRDCKFFLHLLGQCVTRFEWILYAYALMPNHFHLLVELTEETLSKGMHWLNASYAIAFNRIHNRVGHVLQGRFKSPPVEKESYLLELIRYIVLNPVRANIVKRPEDYRWSSYRATIGLAAAPPWLAVDDVLLPFGPDRDLARAGVQDFVNAAIGADTNLWKELFERRYIGRNEWIAHVQERIDCKPRSSEHTRDERLIARFNMDDIIAAVARTCHIDPVRLRCGRDRVPRMVAAWIGRHELSTGPQIAGALHLRSAGHISELIRRCDRELRVDADLRQTIELCMSTLGRKPKIEDLTPNSSS